jgi:hypothetical protein
VLQRRAVVDVPPGRVEWADVAPRLSPQPALIARRKAAGDGGMEALRVLKRRLSDVVYRALLTDASETISIAAAGPAGLAA